MKEITDAFGNWFAGFTDGEGCFCIGKRNYKNRCAQYQCRFAINLRDDDKPILEKIRDTLGIGFVYDRPAYFRPSRNAQALSDFCLQSIKECAQLVKFFEKYPLQAKKQNDFAIWKLAVAELQKPLDCRDADLLEYYFLKIKQVRQYAAQAELPRPKKIELQLSIEF